MVPKGENLEEEKEAKETPYLNLFNTKLGGGFAFSAAKAGNQKERKESNASSNDFDRDESESPLEEQILTVKQKNLGGVFPMPKIERNPTGETAAAEEEEKDDEMLMSTLFNMPSLAGASTLLKKDHSKAEDSTNKIQNLTFPKFGMINSDPVLRPTIVVVDP